MFKNIIYIIFFIAKDTKENIIKYKNFVLSVFQIKIKKNSLFHSYLKFNENYWRKFKTTLNPKTNVLITDFVSTPGYTVPVSILGKYISDIENSSLCGVVRDRDIRGPMIIKSFGVKNIFYLSRGNFLKKLKFFLISIRILNKISNIDEFLKFKYEKINIGLIVYDHILRHTGLGSTNKFSFKFYYFLSVALGINDYCKDFFKKNFIQSVIQSETQYLPSAVVFEYALQNNCKVYAHEGGSKKITVRVYTNISQRFTSKYKFSEELFNYVLENLKETALVESKQIMKIKLEKDIPRDDLIMFNLMEFNLKSNTRKKISKKEICQNLKWDEKKPIIGIFSHDFFDANFVNSRLIFRDNLIWFRKTIKFIRDVKNVNWLIKNHPSDYKKTAKTNARKEMNEIAGDCDHIALFNNEYSASSLPNFLNIILTSSGSVGLEYPCLGIPAILANDAYYAGFGFTIEPRTETEYFSLLKDIKNIEKYKLSKEQIDKANVYNYIALKLSLISMPLLPTFDWSRNLDEKKYININEKFSFENLTVRRSGYVHPSIEIKKLIKKKSDRNRKLEDLIK